MAWHGLKVYCTEGVDFEIKVIFHYPLASSILRKSGRYAGSVSVRFANLNIEKVKIPGTFLYLLVEGELKFAIDTELLFRSI